MFDAFVGDVDIQKQDLGSEGTDVVSAGVATCGVVGKTTKKARRIEVLSLTMDMFGNVFLRDTPYVMVTHARVFAMLPKDNRFGRWALLYVAALLSYCRQVYSFSSMATWRSVQDKRVSLPVTEHGEPDFAYMESIIRTLERERIDDLKTERERVLKAYLQVSGLTSCSLTAEEKSLLKRSPSYNSFKLAELFESLSGDMDIQKRDLGEEGVNVVSAGVASYGIVGRTTANARQVCQCSLTMDMFGNVFVRDEPYVMVTHARVFALLPRDSRFDCESLLYINALLHYCPKLYSFSAMATWRNVRDLSVNLPVLPGTSEIDFAYIHAYIRAIMKEAVYKVVAWKDREIAATQQICSSTLQS